MNIKRAILMVLFAMQAINLYAPPNKEIVKIQVSYFLFTCQYCEKQLYTSDHENLERDYHNHVATQCELDLEATALDSKQKNEVSEDNLIFTATVTCSSNEKSFMAHCKPCSKSYKETTKKELIKILRAHLQFNCPTAQECIRKKAFHFYITEKP